MFFHWKLNIDVVNIHKLVVDNFVDKFVLCFNWKTGLKRIQISQATLQLVNKSELCGWERPEKRLSCKMNVIYTPKIACL